VDWRQCAAVMQRESYPLQSPNSLRPEDGTNRFSETLVSYHSNTKHYNVEELESSPAWKSQIISHEIEMMLINRFENLTY
jgi:hypothetical protein